MRNLIFVIADIFIEEVVDFASVIFAGREIRRHSIETQNRDTISPSRAPFTFDVRDVCESTGNAAEKRSSSPSILSTDNTRSLPTHAMTQQRYRSVC